MKKFCIVIPVYKENIDEYEQVNLLSVINKIKDKKIDVYLVCPESLNVKNYLKLYNKFIVSVYDDYYFKGIYEYSQLCLQYSFYNYFSGYKYMYLIQPDVYIFKDEFDKWVEYDYDYIGAPIFGKDSRWNLTKNGEYYPKVGNGGFSLRKIETFKDITNPDGEFRKTYNIDENFIKKIVIEDKYFCDKVNDLYELNIPDYTEAIHFSWDMSIDQIHEYLHIDYLPFGAHSTCLYYDFYCNFINDYKTNKIKNICNKLIDTKINNLLACLKNK